MTPLETRNLSLQVYLIRHGESTWNASGRAQGWSDPRLSRKGVAQARAVARRMRHLPVQRIYTSPLARAFQTARAIGVALSVPVLPVADFREVGLGIWEGMPITQLRRQYGTLYRTWLRTPSKARIPHGEEIVPFRRRVRSAFLTVLEEANHGGTVAIVTHGGVIRAILADVLQVPFDPLMHGISLGNASMTRVTRTKGRLAVTVLNDTAHVHRV